MYNIFLFVQSQLLTRVSIDIIQNTDRAEHSLSDVVPKIIAAINDCIFKYSTLLKQLNTPQPVKSKIISNGLVDSAFNLKQYSLSFSSKMLALANVCLELDDSIQNLPRINGTDCNDRIKKLQHSMDLIESSILLCQEDFKKCILTYNTILNVDTKMKIIDTLNVDNDFSSDPNIIYFNDLLEVQEEEFYTDIKNEQTNNGIITNSEKSMDTSELTHVDKKLVSMNFKPVLKQLKVKIDPIKTLMRERERKFLISKGLYEDEIENSISSESEDEDKLPIKKRNNYDTERTLLTKKQQFFLPILKLPSPNLEEDILE